MAFASTTSKTAKRGAGRTLAGSTPVAIRSKVALPSGFETTVRNRLAKRVGHAGSLIERGTVRFEDINGPRGGVDITCRIKLVLSGRPSIQVEKRAATVEQALASTLQALETSVRKQTGKQGLRSGKRSRGAAPAKRAAAEVADSGELIGRRTGRGPAAMQRALARPEKARRDAVVDTAGRGVTASDRKAGGGSTARRNTRAKTTRATATLEDSRTTPSRKSTRRSANRAKTSQGKERTAVARSLTSSAKASRAIASRRGR
jgi:hypothetical protein